ncbi:hypothetical protein [Gordonia sp. CPCC 205333]|uniref:hypothetical protein n=1 Tax=Gordonia sp. CPCC 205333 TaxID=3140790 RepID=UPI003AF3D409
MTTRLATNALESARLTRESYLGPWLPEPVDTSADPTLGAETTEALDQAVLLLLENPIGGTIEIGGPEKLPMHEFIPAVLAQHDDQRPIIVDEHATYFGTELTDDSLVPGPNAELGQFAYEKWSTSV